MSQEYELRMLFCDMIEALFRAGATVEAVQFQARYFKLYPILRAPAEAHRDEAVSA